MKRFVGILCLLLIPCLGMAGVTGKISGKVVDKDTGNPLPGANVVIVDTYYGAAADMDGNFFIINVPPGKFMVEATMMGYSRTRIEQVTVSTNSTTSLDFEMTQEVVQGEVVVVTVDAISTKKDETSSIRHVSSDQIAALPVESLSAVVEMQAGVVNGHFRGGRTNEVSYMIDGLQVNDVFSKNNRQAGVENEVIQDVEVITGTFNAEYGRAMSGIVNAVTKDGGNRLHGSISTQFGNYYTTHDDVFIGLKSSDVTRKMNYRLNLSGPIIRDKLTFLVNYRLRKEDNHLNGIYRFNPYDFSDFTSTEPDGWYSEHSGDDSEVALSMNDSYSLYGKLTYTPFNNLKASLTHNRGVGESRGYNHFYKYNPLGIPKSHWESSNTVLLLNHMMSRRLFHELKLLYLDNWDGYFVHEDPLNPQYVNDWYSVSPGPGFSTGGDSKAHNKSYTKRMDMKYDMTWQVNQNHSLKSGFLYTQHDKNIQNHTIVNAYRNTIFEMMQEQTFNADGEMKISYPYYEPRIEHDTTTYSDVYQKKPIEFSAYLQDKMEFDEMVINIGIRYDYFDPKTDFPTQIRNPANQLAFPDNPERMSTYETVATTSQISPRFGLSYTLSGTAKLHFSYGHFFQVPDAYAMYQNHNFLIAFTDFSTVLGNPNLKPEKSVKYELGLWQELAPGVSLDVALYYADVYNLLSTTVLSMYNNVKFGLYTNKDYGNRRGLEIGLNAEMGGLFSSLNYTLQYTQGVADNPMTNFTREGQSIDPVSRLIPLSWDQRHTMNVSLGYQVRRAGGTFTYYYNSGTPYTWAPLSDSRLAYVNLYPNNAVKPSGTQLDFNGHYDVPLAGGMTLRFSALIYNLLDSKNENWVNATTGRANQEIVREVDLLQHRSNFTDYYETIFNPSAYSAPREIKLSVGLLF